MSSSALYNDSLNLHSWFNQAKAEALVELKEKIEVGVKTNKTLSKIEAGRIARQIVDAFFLDLKTKFEAKAAGIPFSQSNYLEYNRERMFSYQPLVDQLKDTFLNHRVSVQFNSILKQDG